MDVKSIMTKVAIGAAIAAIVITIVKKVINIFRDETDEETVEE